MYIYVYVCIYEKQASIAQIVELLLILLFSPHFSLLHLASL